MASNIQNMKTKFLEMLEDFCKKPKRTEYWNLHQQILMDEGKTFVTDEWRPWNRAVQYNGMDRSYWKAGLREDVLKVFKMSTGDQRKFLLSDITYFRDSSGNIQLRIVGFLPASSSLPGPSL